MMPAVPLREDNKEQAKPHDAAPFTRHNNNKLYDHCALERDATHTHYTIHKKRATVKLPRTFSPPRSL